MIEPRTPVWIMVLPHSLIAVLAAMVLGFLPELAASRVLYGTWLEPVMPGFNITALILGYFVAKRLAEPSAAIWVWVPWLCWFLFAFRDLAAHWSPTWDPHPSRWQYALANLFGPTPSCGGTECLYELFATAPFLCSVAYSIGAVLALKRAARVASSLET